jgi:hypothetical protein
MVRDKGSGVTADEGRFPPRCSIRHMSYICLTISAVAINYLQLLRNLVEEREAWSRKRDEAERELSRLSELMRSTIKMLSPEERSKCDCEILLERIDNRPPGLTTFVRGAFSAGKEWLTPVEVRDYLKSIGFNFDKYKANPLASIHTTLRRMVPHEMECKKLDGRKVYRLKTAEQWRASIGEVRNWLEENGIDCEGSKQPVLVLGRREKNLPKGEKRGRARST